MHEALQRYYLNVRNSGTCTALPWLQCIYPVIKFVCCEVQHVIWALLVQTSIQLEINKLCIWGSFVFCPGTAKLLSVLLSFLYLLTFMFFLKALLGCCRTQWAEKSKNVTWENNWIYRRKCRLDSGVYKGVPFCPGTSNFRRVFWKTLGPTLLIPLIFIMKSYGLYQCSGCLGGNWADNATIFPLLSGHIPL